MNNDLTRLLGVRYPIIQGGMVHIAGARLTAAVSEAGGLGTLGQRGGAEEWREQIRKTKALTTKPFAVNLPLHTPELDQKLGVIAEEGVKVVVTAAGNPAQVLGALREAGCKVLHVVAAVKQAEKVAAAGVDAVVAEGGESGGMVAKDRVSTLVLAAMVAERVKVPVVAAGGIYDARGLIAALALGCQGVQMGTAFIATEECEAGPEWKEALIKAVETDTEIVPRGSAQGRALKQHLHPGAMAGQVAGAITRIETVKDIIDRIIGGVGEVMEGIERQVKG